MISSDSDPIRNYKSEIEFGMEIKNNRKEIRILWIENYDLTFIY